MSAEDEKRLREQIHKLELAVRSLQTANHPMIGIGRIFIWSVLYFVLAICIWFVFMSMQNQISQLSIEMSELKQQRQEFQAKGR
jgi:hypothetical protein